MMSHNDHAMSCATVFALKSVENCHYQDQLAMKLQCKPLNAGCLNLLGYQDSFRIFKKICNPILYYYILYETKLTGRTLVNLETLKKNIRDPQRGHESKFENCLFNVIALGKIQIDNITRWIIITQTSKTKNTVLSSILGFIRLG